MSIVEDYINEIEEWLDESEGTDGVNGQNGPLTGDPLSYVTTRLRDSLTNITHLLSADHLNDAGTADLTGLPSDLPGVAGWCHDKAVDLQAPSLSEAAQGSLLKSIRDAINLDPGGYKKLAGI